MICHSTIIRGLLRSHNIIQDISKIPCDVINTLETDVDAAKNFVTELEQGRVPELIKDLPQEIIGTFHDLINIAASLPTEIFDAAQAVVTDVVHVFDDIENGSIVSDLERVPSIVVSDVTAGWGDFTHGVVGLWNGVTGDIACAFESCPTSTATTIGSCVMATSTAGNDTQSYTPAQTTPSIGSPTPIAAYSTSVFGGAAASGGNNSSVEQTTTKPVSPTQKTTTSPWNTGNPSTTTLTKATGSSAAPAQSSLAGGSNESHNIAVWTMAILGALGIFICWL